MLQLSSGQAPNPFASLYCWRGWWIFGHRSGLWALPIWEEQRVMGREGQRARHECHGELKSLVASLLPWLPRDQRGAKSTQRRKKWRVFREEQRGDSEWWRDKENRAEKDACTFSLRLSSAVTQCSALAQTKGKTINGVAVNVKGDSFHCRAGHKETLTPAALSHCRRQQTSWRTSLHELSILTDNSVSYPAVEVFLIKAVFVRSVR